MTNVMVFKILFVVCLKELALVAVVLGLFSLELSFRNNEVTRQNYWMGQKPQGIFWPKKIQH